jgi:hypothetical protein
VRAVSCLSELWTSPSNRFSSSGVMNTSSYGLSADQAGVVLVAMVASDAIIVSSFVPRAVTASVVAAMA